MIMANAGEDEDDDQSAEQVLSDRFKIQQDKEEEGQDKNMVLDKQGYSDYTEPASSKTTAATEAAKGTTKPKKSKKAKKATKSCKSPSTKLSPTKSAGKTIADKVAEMRPIADSTMQQVDMAIRENVLAQAIESSGLNSKRTTKHHQSK